MAEPRGPRPQARRDPAVARLWVLTGARAAGLVPAVLGLWLAGGSGGAPARVAAGMALVLTGMLLVLFLPRALLRRWRGRR